jgi:hypothetical protein
MNFKGSGIIHVVKRIRCLKITWWGPYDGRMNGPPSYDKP